MQHSTSGNTAKRQHAGTDAPYTPFSSSAFSSARMLAAFSPTPWHRAENSNVSRTFSCGRRSPGVQRSLRAGTNTKVPFQSHLGLVQVRLLDVGGGALHDERILVVPVISDVALHLHAG